MAEFVAVFITPGSASMGAVAFLDTILHAFLIARLAALGDAGAGHVAHAAATSGIGCAAGKTGGAAQGWEVSLQARPGGGLAVWLEIALPAVG